MDTGFRNSWLWGTLIVVAITAFAAGFYLSPLPTPNETGVDLVEPEPLSLVPEGWRRLEDYTIVIDIGILPGELQSVWVEYGLTADALSQKTPPTSQELGMGTRGQYGSYSVTIPPAELEPGLSYFYRILAKTEAGETIRTGLSRFTAGK